VQSSDGPELEKAAWRAYAFRVSLWALIAVLYFFSPFILVVLGWFQEPFSELGGAESVSHRVHEVLFEVIFAQAMLGAVSQLRNPIGRRAGMLQTLAALFGFVAALASPGSAELYRQGRTGRRHHVDRPQPSGPVRAARFVAVLSATGRSTQRSAKGSSRAGLA
jgi:hypothetical protein